MELQDDVKQARGQLYHLGRRKVLCEVLELRALDLTPPAVQVLLLPCRRPCCKQLPG